MAKRKSRCRFVLNDADTMRASLRVTPNRLAGAAGCSTATTQLVLDRTPRTKTVCERIVNGLQKLGHPRASHNQITEV